MFKSTPISRARALAHLNSHGILYAFLIADSAMAYGFWNLFHH